VGKSFTDASEVMKKTRVIEIVVVAILVLGGLSFFMQSSMSSAVSEKSIPDEPALDKGIIKEVKTTGNEEALEKRIHDLQREILDLKSVVALKEKENHRLASIASEKSIPQDPALDKGIIKEVKTTGNEEALEKRIHDLQQELLDLKSDVALKDKENHRLAILTINTPPFYKAWAGIVVTNRKKYCKKHGYALYMEHGKSDDRSPVWSKITALLQHMEEDRHEWYWALDLDALLMNGNKKASEYLDDGYDLIVNNDCNWFNAGSFFIRNSEWSKQYLKKGTMS
jgi:ribosomal protein L29